MDNKFSCNLICENCILKTKCVMKKIEMEGPSYAFSFNVLRKIEIENSTIKWGWRILIPLSLAGIVFIYMILSYFINIPTMPSLMEYMIPDKFANIFKEYKLLSMVISLALGTITGIIMLYKNAYLQKTKNK